MRVVQFSNYFREKMSFWSECETLTFGRLLGGVPCTTDSDCYVGVCSRTNSTCSYSKDEAETGFVEVRVGSWTQPGSVMDNQC